MIIFSKKISKRSVYLFCGALAVLAAAFIFWFFSGFGLFTTKVREENGEKGELMDMPNANTLVKLSPRARKLAEIEVASVERKFVRAKVRLYGKIDYDETRVIFITAWVPGRIEKQYVNFTGMEVKAGDSMVEYYSPELIVAQEELLQFLELYQELKGSRKNFLKEQSLRNLESARDKLRFLGIKDEQIKDIELDRKVREFITIYAPDSGIVIQKESLEGEYVKEGTKIYTIANLDELWVQMEAYESDLLWIKMDQEASFITYAYPGRKFYGRVSFIDPFLNEKTRTASIRVNIDNRAGLLKPGMYVTATIRSFITADGKIYAEEPKDERPPLVIPATAPLITGKRAIVYIQNPEIKSEFSLREINLGPRAGDYYIVDDGLQEGELVVVNGNFKIDSSAQIEAQPSMMMPKGGVKKMMMHGK